MDFNAGTAQVWMVFGVVNEIRELSLTQFFGFKSEDKQEGINHV
jgi:hypothetical protein